MTYCTRCGQKYSSRSFRCPVCHRLRIWPELQSKRFRIGVGIVVLAVVAGLVVVRARLKNTSPVQAAPEAAQVPVAEELRVIGEASVVPIAVDEATLDVLRALPSARYGLGYPKLLREGHVFEIPGNSRVTIVKEEKTRVLIRVATSSGEKTGWVQPSWIVSSNTEWTPTLREPAEVD